jgi:hypothetical protein
MLHPPRLTASALLIVALIGCNPPQDPGDATEGTGSGTVATSV